MKRIRLCGSARIRRALAGVTLAAVFAALASCSDSESTLQAMRDAYGVGDYEETIVQCRHALRNDIDGPEVYFFYAQALLALGRDFESFQRFGEAIDSDPGYAPRVSQILIEHGGDSYARGDEKRASDRLRAAAELNPEAELGLYQYLVGNTYFSENRLVDAARCYQGALAIDPDTSLAEQAMFNLSACMIAAGDSAGAMETLEALIATFPKSDLKGQASWKLCDLLYEDARTQFTRGNYDTVVERITVVIDRAQNLSLKLRARFLLGETHERLGDFQSAYEQYRAIIDEDRGASGRIVERARERISAFRESGLL